MSGLRWSEKEANKKEKKKKKARPRWAIETSAAGPPSSSAPSSFYLFVFLVSIKISALRFCDTRRYDAAIKATK